MNTLPPDKTAIEDFWIRCYLNPKECLKEAAINRAYRDLARTLHNLKRTDSVHGKFKAHLLSTINDVCSKKLKDQKEFDVWHEQRCLLLIEEYRKSIDYKLFIGQAQKWINMSLKYLVALGDKRIPGIITNYHLFHIPIDNIIQEHFLLSDKIKKISGSWSRIDDYTVYMQYQIKIRESYPGEAPLNVEFRSYNSSSSWNF
ncbi:hypothetical protein [Olivibacter oleidegradans]|uniref:J domain-containing protein n=1 Tax=Olivibacter oleidegradans TaxID=760123 RepID=A0ABV6HDG7_9SPHI